MRILRGGYYEGGSVEQKSYSYEGEIEPLSKLIVQYFVSRPKCVLLIRWGVIIMGGRLCGANSGNV